MLTTVKRTFSWNVAQVRLGLAPNCGKLLTSQLINIYHDNLFDFILLDIENVKSSSEIDCNNNS